MARRSRVLPGALAAVLLVVALGGDRPDPDPDTARAADAAAQSPPPTDVSGHNEPKNLEGRAAAVAKAAEAYEARRRAENPRSFTLVATGDVLLHGTVQGQGAADADSAVSPGGFDFRPLLEGVAPLVESADLAVCHLETPIAPAGGPYAGYPAFSVPLEIAPALADTGYDACTTASNHTYDRGAGGVDRTLDALDAAGIRHAGSARTPTEAASVTLLDTDDQARVALLSYTYGFNGVPAPDGQTWRSNPIDEARILADAAGARSQGADVVVVALHWGDEYRHEPNELQAELAPRLIRSPAIDLLLGHHAHVVQPVEQIDGEWVVYGLGNLVANHRTPGAANEEGLLVRFTFTEPEADGDPWRVSAAHYAPLLVAKSPQIRVVDIGRALADPATDPVLRTRLQTAWDRTTAVVAERGGPTHGLRPIAP
jgi:poly-gamma-glutamate synthesis protein (capsule biosynthesis protein)